MRYSFLRPLLILIGVALTLIGLGMALFACYLLYLMFLNPAHLPFVDGLHAIAETFAVIVREIVFPDGGGKISPLIGFLPIAVIAVFLLAALGGIVRALTFAGVDLMKFALRISSDEVAVQTGLVDTISIDDTVSRM